MFNSDPREVLKQQKEPDTHKYPHTITATLLLPLDENEAEEDKPNLTKQITKAALLALCDKTLRRRELTEVLSREFHRRKVLEVVAILEQLRMVRVLYKSGDESEPTDEDIVTANKNFIICATSFPQLEEVLRDLREINRDLELSLSTLLSSL